MFSPVETVPVPSHSVGRLTCGGYSIAQEGSTVVPNRTSRPFVDILEQPVSIGARFRYKCEGRSAGCIRGVNSADKQKTYPTIKVHGYQGAAGVVVSCVTKDGPPYFPHPHNLVGKTCTNGVCYKSINSPDMVCNFANLGIQCVKKKDIKESLSHRESIQVDPFGTGFTHHLSPNKINLNALRLCFQVFLPDDGGKLSIPLLPVISNPIFDNKTVSDLTITKLSHYSSPVTGGQESILLCDQVNKDDIQIVFYEESDNKVVWCDYGKFAPHHVHRKAAISFQTPSYKNLSVQQSVDCFIQLRRPSDGAVGKPRSFTFQPLRQDPEGMARKRSKFEALKLDQALQPNNLPICNVNSGSMQRPIKQAVRSKAVNQNGSIGNFHPTFGQGADIRSTSLKQSITENVNMHLKNSQICDPALGTTSSPTHLLTSRQKVEDILAVAKEQIGMCTPQGFCEVNSDETLDKLSSLDLGIDPNDLEVNLSGITLDSFSSGLNFSTSSTGMKNLIDKL